MPEFLYCEPVKGDIYKFSVVDVNETLGLMLVSSTSSEDRVMQLPSKVFPDGSYYLKGYGSFWPETEKWMIRYQDSLSRRVSQKRTLVYYIYSMTRGKVSTRSFVIDDNGLGYHTLVPTFPPPRFGESFMKLRMDLTVVSLEPKLEWVNKVKAVRRADPTLL